MPELNEEIRNVKIEDFPISEFYKNEILYKERARIYEYESTETEDHDFILSLALQNDVSSILEVFSGVGRNVLKLSETGKEISAVDLEPNMIEVLKKKAELNSLVNVNAFVGDVRTFYLSKKFDLIIIPREAFQMLLSQEDRLKALINLSEHLSSTGTLMLDLANFYRKNIGCNESLITYYAPGIEDGTIVKDWTKKIDNGYKLTRYHSQNTKKDNYIKFQFFYILKNGLRQCKKFSSNVELYKIDLNEVLELLKAAGLTVDIVYGDYNKTNFNNNSRRMILLSSK